ncbi:response regulator [Leptothoe spongobia]|uniref:Response regulator n=1 Tax=Leptothoe spongobia TAU-MAC 1115 TaxID=1967444 RepID=A0A947DK83_9CYAN|nr:response regulator [Leptothoe spongobia]MBT9317361.1 response regulator [Leptothoe spongobia TAU-MAC 1115]
MALIFITDDAAFTRRMIRKALQPGDNEHVILEAANGVECVNLLESHTPDCIFLDLLMPELDGYGVLQTIKDRQLDISVIVLSADIQDSARERCMALGAFAMLKKPPKGPEICEMIQTAIDKA